MLSKPARHQSGWFYQGVKMEFEDDLNETVAVAANIDFQAAKKTIFELIRAVGEDPEREGLRNTPDRVSRMYAELLSGYSTNPQRIINGALFNINYDEMVLVRDIEFYSLCEHHLLPFLGRAHVAYLPAGRVIGLSKIPRIVDMYARRLQVQERMTRQIANFLNEILDARGVAVVVEGKHMCSMMRGVQKHDSSMTTSTMLGAFRENTATRNEFMAHLGRTHQNFGV